MWTALKSLKAGTRFRLTSAKDSDRYRVIEVVQEGMKIASGNNKTSKLWGWEEVESNCKVWVEDSKP